MKHTHFFGNADTVFQKEKRFCAFQIDSLRIAEGSEGISRKIVNLHESAEKKKLRETEATRAVQGAVKSSIEGMGRFSERMKSHLMFKDQTERIQKAAQEISRTGSAWFESRKEELGADFDEEAAYALALQEVRNEMTLQVRELEEKQRKAKESIAKVRENLRWYRIDKGTSLRISEWKGARAERRASIAKDILDNQIRDLDTRFGNIRSARKQFTEITGITEEQLTNIIARKEIENGSEVTLNTIIDRQPKELKRSLKVLRAVLEDKEGTYFNNIQRAKGLLESINDKKAFEEKMKTAKKEDIISIETKGGTLKYQVTSVNDEKVTLRPTHDRGTLPAFVFDKKTQKIRESSILNFAQRFGSEIKKAKRTASDTINTVKDTAEDVVKTAAESDVDLAA